MKKVKKEQKLQSKVKKSQKTPTEEIERAMRLKNEYFQQKRK